MSSVENLTTENVPKVMYQLDSGNWEGNNQEQDKLVSAGHEGWSGGRVVGDAMGIILT